MQEQLSISILLYSQSADLWFNKLLGYIEGQGNNRFIFVDSAGNMLLTQGSEEGKSRGFLSSKNCKG